jgi:hypothetical protein
MAAWLIAGLLILPSACRRDDDNDKSFLSTYIYVAGSVRELSGSFWTPCVWKNGVAEKLNFPAEQHGHAVSVFVSGSSVYAAGYLMYPMKSWGVPMYWKDGARVDLPVLPGDMGGVANGIRVVNGDIYVSGYRAADYYRYSTKTLLAIPCYWKNNVLTSLPVISEDVGGLAESIFVSANDVYIAGSVLDGSGDFSVPCYWKNGQRIDLGLPGTCRSAMAKSLFIEGDDVYVSASGFLQSWLSVPLVWTNGTWTELSKINPAGYGWTSGLSVDGHDVHVCGGTWDEAKNPTPCTWMNNERFDLPGGPDGYALDIQVFAGDAYVAGYTRSSGPCYWKNGALVKLSYSEIGNSGMAQAIFVVNQ